MPVPAINEPLALLMTGAGIDQKTVMFATSLMSAVPGAIAAGIAVQEALAPSIAAFADMASAKRQPTDAEFDQLDLDLAKALAIIQAADKREDPPLAATS